MARNLDDSKVNGKVTADDVETPSIRGIRCQMFLNGAVKDVTGQGILPVIRGGFGVGTSSELIKWGPRVILGRNGPIHPFVYQGVANTNFNLKTAFGYPTGILDLNVDYSALFFCHGVPYDEQITCTVNSTTYSFYPPYLIIHYKEETPWGDGHLPYTVVLWSPNQKKETISGLVDSGQTRNPVIKINSDFLILENKT